MAFPNLWNAQRQFALRYCLLLCIEAPFYKGSVAGVGYLKRWLERDPEVKADRRTVHQRMTFSLRKAGDGSEEW